MPTTSAKDKEKLDPIELVLLYSNERYPTFY
jgi:hypothetical protein